MYKTKKKNRYYLNVMIISYFFGDRRLNRANERKIGLILYKIRCGYNYKQHIWSDFYFFFSFLGL